MRKNKYSPRHAPSFILLFLARRPNYGGALLKMMEEEIPCFLGDSSMIYRTLQELEEEGAITSRWEMPDTGRPIKYYYLTDQGWKLLLESEDDMRKRIDNHLFFLDELEKAKNRKK
ncbi:MAG: hypothetical protein APF84_07525 [Gracilibacter sp. BRH_c7a]|nr:MAG: hypothetical protein APF84_07525 [Gracilibacter sp. BRH_c7a]